MASAQTRILDLSDRAAKRELQAYIGGLHGPHEVTIKQRFRGRTLAQNALYWVSVVPALVDGIKEQWGEDISSDDAHQMLKERFLRVEMRHVDEETGVVQTAHFTRSTTKLDTKDFAEYLERCRDFLQEWFGISVWLPGDTVPVAIYDEQTREAA